LCSRDASFTLGSHLSNVWLAPEEEPGYAAATSMRRQRDQYAMPLAGLRRAAAGEGVAWKV